MPIYFENGSTELSDPARHVMDSVFIWYCNIEGTRGTRIVLRTYTTGEPTSDLARLSEARADTVRSALIARNVDAENIMIAHTYSNEPRLVDEGWIGGWIYPEYYVTRSVRDRLFPNDGTQC